MDIPQELLAASASADPYRSAQAWIPASGAPKPRAQLRLPALPALPPYVYGREAGENEKLFPLSSIERWLDEVFAAISSSALESARAQFPAEQVRWWAQALQSEPQVGSINGAVVIAMLSAFGDVLEQSAAAGTGRSEASA